MSALFQVGHWSLLIVIIGQLQNNYDKGTPEPVF